MITTKKDIQPIIDLVAQQRNIPPDLIQANTRRREVLEPRYMCYWLMRKHTTLTLVQIGVLVGNRDHATVMHGIKVIDNLIETDNGFCAEMETLEARFEGTVKHKLSNILRKNAYEMKLSKMHKVSEIVKLVRNKHNVHLSEMFYTAYSIIKDVEQELINDKALEGWRRDKIEKMLSQKKSDLLELKYQKV